MGASAAATRGSAPATAQAELREPAAGAGRPLTVAMLSNLFLPVMSGSATHSLGLARALTDKGHRVIVITARVDRNSAEHEAIDGVEIYRLPAVKLPEMAISLNFPWLNWTFWPANLRRMAEILQRHGVEILHVHNHMFDMALAGVVLRRRLGLPMVLTIHTVIKHSIAAFNLLLSPADRWALKHLVVKQADAVVCPDVNIEVYLDERFGRRDGVLIPYGIDLPPEPGPEVERDIRERFGLDGKRVILSLGHLHALRNRLDLIRAMPRIRDRFPNVVLLIVGAVKDQRAVALVKELGLEDTVLFAGPQPHAHVPAYHAVAELEAMWLDQAEGGMNSLGVACMEAMYAGRTVLTVSNEDTFGRGVLESGRDVVIVKAREPERLAATICDLLENPGRIDAIGRAARALAQRLFAWDSVAVHTAELYRSVLAKAPRRTGDRTRAATGG